MGYSDAGISAPSSSGSSLKETKNPGVDDFVQPFGDEKSMHIAKGLKFRTVAVLACNDDVIPLKERIEAVADDSDLKEIYTSERRLLYVACTRARDHLFVSGVKPGSEFLDHLST